MMPKSLSDLTIHVLYLDPDATRSPPPELVCTLRRYFQVYFLARTDGFRPYEVALTNVKQKPHLRESLDSALYIVWYAEQFCRFPPASPASPAFANAIRNAELTADELERRRVMAKFPTKGLSKSSSPPPTSTPVDRKRKQTLSDEAMTVTVSVPMLLTDADSEVELNLSAEEEPTSRNISLRGTTLKGSPLKRSMVDLADIKGELPAKNFRRLREMSDLKSVVEWMDAIDRKKAQRRAEQEKEGAKERMSLAGSESSLSDLPHPSINWQHESNQIDELQRGEVRHLHKNQEKKRVEAQRTAELREAERAERQKEKEQRKLVRDVQYEERRKKRAERFFSSVFGSTFEFRSIDTECLRSRSVAEEFATDDRTGAARYGRSAALLATDPTHEWTDHVYVTESTIPNAGRGLFAKRNFEKGERITCYSGWPISKEQAVHLRQCNLHQYVIGGMGGGCVDGIRDPSEIPAGGGAASLANDRKVRRLNNAQFRKAYCHKTATHGKWLVAVRPIQTGEEITASYGKGFWRIAQLKERLSEQSGTENEDNRSLKGQGTCVEVQEREEDLTTQFYSEDESDESFCQ